MKKLFILALSLWFCSCSPQYNNATERVMKWVNDRPNFHYIDHVCYWDSLDSYWFCSVLTEHQTFHLLCPDGLNPCHIAF